ncbi:nuclease-related domain-containing protein [Evansella sp. AB-P1]|uniref:nuclease-related domain-containing protein n=1 Tax=Evansella sp. AB-P1 TaxID=3037653 RepID=UPI00241DD556|nr:nuclease-related domain-containing protein [Evansella sp. AB-P1]MDG5787733.1 nuclease-related domain-containing protein [Evansella sp. AB-P1]
MAQLVKLSDYISRYEVDLYKYPSRFVRLKKERWRRLLANWENRSKQKAFISYDIEEKKFSKELRSRMKSLLFRKGNSTEEKQIVDYNVDKDDYKNKEELKEAFLEEIFHFQLNWASSTISEISPIKQSFYHDAFLFDLLKKLPDTYFVFYQPLVFSKKTKVEMDIFILTPTELWLVTPLTGNDRTIFKRDSDRFWTKEFEGEKGRILDPIIALKRMRTVLEPILTENEFSLPIRTAVIAKDSYIDILQPEYPIKLIDKRNIVKWYEVLNRNVAPMKHQQLKLADVILAKCASVWASRPNGSMDFQATFDTEVEDDESN